MNKFKQYIYLLLPACLIGASTLVSCTKNFEKYNTDPNAVTEETLEYDNLKTGVFFAQMQQNIFPIAQPPAFGDEMYQIMQNLAGDVYSGYMGASNNWFGSANNTTYAMIPNWYNAGFGRSFLGVMPAWLSIKQRTQDNPGLQHVYSLAQIIKVTSVHRTTDMYGPLPYFNFGNGSLTTNYNSQESIYNSFFTDLDLAITELTDFIAENPGQKPLAAYDLIYGGDYVKWIKFANSLKLRLAMRMANVNEAKAKEFAESAVANSYGVLTSNDDNALLRTGSALTFNNPLYIISNNFEDIRMGANMESFLKGYNDPRMRMMFKPAPNGGFHGIRNGIVINNKAAYSLPFSELNVETTTPIVWMLAAEMYFLRAEGAIRGWNMGGTAQSLYETGIQTSFTFWGAGMATSYLADDVSKPAEYIDIASSSNNVALNSPLLSTITIKWDDASTFNQQLERIITQKWIAMYPDGQEAWSEFRRTRFPKIFPVVSNQSNGVIASGGFIRRLPFPQTEYLNNPSGVATGISVLGGLDNIGTKLWWDVNP